MPRITQPEIDRVNQEVDLVALIQSKGLECIKHGEKELATKCPFHEKNDGTLIVTPSTNSWKCVDCSKGGSVIDFIMAHDGLSQRHAYEILSNGQVKALLRSGDPIRRNRSPKLESPISFDVDDSTLLEQVIDYYHQRLKQSPIALGYLTKRGITLEAIDHFQIGYADRTLGLRLPDAATKSGTEIRGKLKSIGLWRESSGHEHFNGCVVFPFKNDSEEIVQVYGRKVTKKLRKGTPLHLYLKTSCLGVFNAKESSLSREIILCESVINALTFWCSGFRNVTCIARTGGLTEELLHFLIQNKTEKIYLAYGRDEEGERAVKREADMLISNGIECYRITFPSGMDANDYAKKTSPADDSLRGLIQSSEWLGKAKPSPREKIPEIEVEPLPEPKLKTASIGTETLSKEKKPSDWEPIRQGDDLTFDLGYRNYRVRGLDKNQSYDVLRVNLRVMSNGLYHVNVLDLYQAKQRQQFIAEASKESLLEPELIKRDLGKLLLALESLQQQRLQEPTKANGKIIPSMTDEENRLAMELLRDPKLLERIVSDFSITGESTNKLAGYLGTVSRLLDRPLAIIIQSTSAAGKSSLMEAVLSMMPEEEVIKYSAMTGQSLYYLGENDLKHKILAIVEEAGAAKASYALKLLQSEGELIIASTSKDDQGRMKTEEYRVEGPVMLFLTTTAIDIDEELLNRCFVLTVDESRKQTEAIHQLQRAAETLDGFQRKITLNGVLRLRKNAQRLLRSIPVVNPFAPRLTFMSDRTRTRRDHIKYLTLIRTVTLLHQHQRTIQVLPDGTEYLEVTLSDISAANRIAHDLSGRSLDELPPQTRKLLGLLDDFVSSRCEELKVDRKACLLSRREIRAALGWGDTQLKVHLSRLLDMEYLALHRNPNQIQSHLYELLYVGKPEDGKRFLPGLIEVESLYDSNWSGINGNQSGIGRVPVGGMSVGGRSDKMSSDGIKIEGAKSKGTLMTQKSQEGDVVLTES